MNWEAYKAILRDGDLDAVSILEKLNYQDLSPVDLRRIFLLLSRSCFSKVGNYNTGDAEEIKQDPPLIYSEDKYLKKIDVNLDYVYDPEEVGVRPGVFVGLGDISYERQVMDDWAGRSEDNSTRYFANVCQTTLNIRHLTTSPDLCYTLANITAEFYLGITDMLQESMPGLGDFQLKQISRIQPVDPENEKQFKVDVVFSVAFMFAWRNIREGHRLKEISLGNFGLESWE